MSFDFKDKQIHIDFEYRLKEKMPYLLRHFKNKLMAVFYFLLRKRIENLIYDCADIGWGICHNQYNNINNELYWEPSESIKKRDED